MKTLAVILVVVCSTVCSTGAAESLDKSFEPNLGTFYLETLGSGYHGLILENDSTVNVTPPIKTVGELVCGFSIIKRHHHHKSEIPFEIEIKDQKAGTAELRAKNDLNCEQKKSYQFEIQAISCSGTYSDSVGVHVLVQDVNEFAPVWKNEKSLSVAVEEGQLFQEIIKVEAEDGDCSPKFGDICKYDIESQGQPFKLSKEGVLSNTEPLNYSVSHSYILSIVAYDCGMKKSAPLLLTVEVKKACNSGWSGVSSRLDYVPGTGPQSIFGQATFSSCFPASSAESKTCKPESFESTIRLQTRHIGKGCDRDTYNLESQRQLCGASAQALDLLSDSDWLKGFGLRDSGRSGDASMIKLDGKVGAIVPDNLIGSNPGHKFTLATWLRHAESLDGDKHRKEHIICKADDHKKNRHHFAVFVRNCKLVLLLREEYHQGEENIFRPAEWRWTMPQVCDDEWHHYALNVNFPDVELIVDGEKWIEEKDNPEIIDDWPLHPAGDITTKTTIGACWQGSEGDFKHGLRGYMAGLSLLPGATEHAEVLKCLHQCAESLQVPAAVRIEPGMEMVENSGQNRVVIDGSDEENMSKLIRQIAYLNTREFPAPGKRTAILTTKIKCKNGDTVSMQEQRTDIHVIPVPEPSIQIMGTDNFERDYQDFKLGVRIFADAHIVMSTGVSSAYGGNGEPVNGIENRLDFCSVTVSPPLNPDHEELNVPEDLLRMLNIVGKVSMDGAEFAGAEMIYNYERVLRQITYTNKKPAYYLNRQFKVSCSELNKRFVSNEYIQTLTVLHPSVKEDLVDDEDESVAHSSAKLVSPKNANRMFHSHGVEFTGSRVYHQNNYIHSLVGHPRGNVAAVITVVAVAFFIVLLSVGVIRLRARHKRAAREELQAETEMAWDDSALTITVNPMEAQPKDLNGGNSGAVNLIEEGFDDVSDEDEEEEDEYEEEEEEEEEESSEDEGPGGIAGAEGGARERLEWDHNI